MLRLAYPLLVAVPALLQTLGFTSHVSSSRGFCHVSFDKQLLYRSPWLCCGPKSTARRLIYVASPLSSLPFHSIKKSGREPLLPCDIESWVSRRLHSRSTSVSADITCAMSTVSLRNDPRHYVVRRCVCASFSSIARHIPDCLYTATPATAMSRLTKLITSTR